MDIFRVDVNSTMSLVFGQAKSLGKAFLNLPKDLLCQLLLIFWPEADDQVVGLFLLRSGVQLLGSDNLLDGIFIIVFGPAAFCPSQETLFSCWGKTWVPSHEVIGFVITACIN